MSLPLKDIRAKVSVETFAVIKGWAVANNMDEAQVVRMILDGWADRFIHATRVAHSALEVEGIEGQDGATL